MSVTVYLCCEAARDPGSVFFAVDMFRVLGFTTPTLWPPAWGAFF